MIPVMAYDETLAARLRAMLQDELDVTEKRMFGAIAYLASGNLAVAASGQGGLMLKCDPEELDRLLAEDGVEHFEMKGRRMNGWLRVDARVLVDDAALERYVEIGLDQARSLPPK